MIWPTEKIKTSSFQTVKKQRGQTLSKVKKRDIIPVHEKAIEIIDKAEEANNGDLQLKNERERWGVRGELQNTALKKSWWINQNPSTNGNQKVTDLKEKQLEQHRLHLSKEKYSFRARKWKLIAMAYMVKNEAAGPVKTGKEPPSKQQKVQQHRRPAGQPTHF